MSSPERPSTTIRVRVISGLIIAGVIAVCAKSPPLLRWLWQHIKDVCIWLVSVQPVYGWLVLIGACAICTLAILILRGLGKHSAIALNAPSEADFRSFQFQGMLWRWDYNSAQAIVTLASFCTAKGCDMQISPKSFSPGYGGETTQEYTCKRCGQKKQINGSAKEVEREVTLEIQRLLRNGEWVQHVKPLG